jgi:hypothetical protein
MDAKTHEHANDMLRRQGALLDAWLAQNLGEPYVFVILAAPAADGPHGHHCIHNLRDDGIAERLTRDFAIELQLSDPPRLAAHTRGARA